MDSLGLPGGVVDGLVPVSWGEGGVAGRARTATVVETGEPGIPGLSALLDDLRPGDVLVLAYETAAVASVFGGLAATRTVASGCRALVVDGWVRDVEELRSFPLPVWARGTTPRSGKGRLAVTRPGEPVTVGGTAVREGDTVVVDATGACVVPAGASGEVLAAAADLVRRDEVFRQELARGAGFGDARDVAGTM